MSTELKDALDAMPDELVDALEEADNLEAKLGELVKHAAEQMDESPATLALMLAGTMITCVGPPESHPPETRRRLGVALMAITAMLQAEAEGAEVEIDVERTSRYDEALAEAKLPVV